MVTVTREPAGSSSEKRMSALQSRNWPVTGCPDQLVANSSFPPGSTVHVVTGCGAVPLGEVSGTVAVVAGTGGVGARGAGTGAVGAGAVTGAAGAAGAGAWRKTPCPPAMAAIRTAAVISPRGASQAPARTPGIIRARVASRSSQWCLRAPPTCRASSR